MSAEFPFSLPGEDGSSWKSARVELHRCDCDDGDTVAIPAAADSNERRQQASQKGLSTVVWQRGAMRIVPSAQLHALE